MYSVFHKLNDSIINRPHSTKNEGLHIIFCSKFKNLLDDYISNYFTKYLFYFLFIAFWIFEIFSILNNITNFEVFRLFLTRNHVGAFKEIAHYTVTELPLMPYIFSFFKFNFDFICYYYSIFTGESIFSVYLFLVFFILVLLLVEYYTHLKQVSIFTLVSCYFFLLFIVFNTFYFGLFSELTAIMAVPHILLFLCILGLGKRADGLDLCIVAVVLFLSLVHPIFMIILLFGVAFLFKDCIPAMWAYLRNTSSHLNVGELLVRIVSDISAIYLLLIVFFSLKVLHFTSTAFLLFSLLYIFLVFDYAYSFFIRKK